MAEVFICDYVRTPIGRYGGALAKIRADDLAAIPIKALMQRYPNLDWAQLEEVILGCANQAGEDNRNVARMALLLAGLPESVPALTVNRLCASGLDAVAVAARAIKSNEIELAMAGGVESMSRAPFVIGKSPEAFARHTEFFDTTIGWRFINPLLKAQYGVDSMPETAENVASQFAISRTDQDAFALRSQQRAAAATAFHQEEMVAIDTGKVQCSQDEHPRATSLEKLSSLKPIVHATGTVTAGNASGVNDGAAALLLASESTANRLGLRPRARVLGMASAAVAPRIMGIGPVPATQKLLARLALKITDFAVIELNEAFASQALYCLRELGLPFDAPNVNPNGGAIALGHPLGMSGARLVMTAVHQLDHTGQRYGLATMCVGVGQGVAMAVERL